MLETIQPIVVAAVVGALSGTHTAIWGMYKDAVHEGFDVTRFARSIVVGCISAMALQYALELPLGRASSLVLLFGLAYASERGIVEVWKTFIRDEDQSKYFIPMQFSIRGEPVKDARVRLAACALYVLGVSLCLMVIARLDGIREVNLVTTSLVGLATGLIIAVGGCWKDAPKEGFDALKFTRSPSMTVVYAVLLSAFTSSYLLIAIGAIGYERATVETYKKFFFPTRAPGKFTGKPVAFPEMVHRRRFFVPAYATIWALVLIAAVVALYDRAGQLPVSTAA